MPRHCSHRQSAIIKAYAEAEGIGTRAAQIHRKNGERRWLDFLKRSGMGGEPEGTFSLVTVEPTGALAMVGNGATDAPGKSDEGSEEDFAGLSLEAEAVKRHETMWRSAAKAAALAADKGDADKSMYFSQIAAHNLRALEAARRAFEKAEVTARNLIPAGEFFEFSNLVSIAAAIVRGIPRELGEKVNPDRPEIAIAALNQWVENRFNSIMDELISVARGERAIDQIQEAA